MSVQCRPPWTPYRAVRSALGRLSIFGMVALNTRGGCSFCVLSALQDWVVMRDHVRGPLKGREKQFHESRSSVISSAPADSFSLGPCLRSLGTMRNDSSRSFYLLYLCKVSRALDVSPLQIFMQGNARNRFILVDPGGPPILGVLPCGSRT